MPIAAFNGKENAECMSRKTHKHIGNQTCDVCNRLVCSHIKCLNDHERNEHIIGRETKYMSDIQSLNAWNLITM